MGSDGGLSQSNGDLPSRPLPAPAGELPPRLDRQPNNVLVIDDDEFICGVIADHLASLGITRVTTSCGDQSTVDLINDGGPFDLIITDLAMPIVDGLQLTRMIAVRQPAAAVLYVSAAGPRLTAVAKALAAGRGLRVLGSLEKPVSREQLSSVLGCLSAAASPPASTVAAETAASPLIRLLDRFIEIPQLQQSLSAVKAQALGDASGAGLGSAADHLGEIVYRHCADLDARRAGVVRLLEQMTSGLDQMSGYLSEDARSRRQARDESERLSNQLLGEVTGLDADIREASDLALLQEDMRRRLESIGASVQESRLREETRMREFEDRAGQMKARIDQLEAETLTLKTSVEREHAAASTDRLTGIANRLSYDQRMQHDWAHWKRYGGSLLIAIWDIDKFKSVNDTYGHAAGDKTLQAIGQHLAKQVRATDFIARFGGEEFVMLLQGASMEGALALADKWRESVARIGFHFNQQPVSVTVSCGIASFAPADTPESVFERADAALYQAKKAGRNRCLAG